MLAAGATVGLIPSPAGEESLQRRGMDTGLAELARRPRSRGKTLDRVARAFCALADHVKGCRFPVPASPCRPWIRSGEVRISSTTWRWDGFRKLRVPAWAEACSGLIMGSTAFWPAIMRATLARSLAMVSGVVKLRPLAYFWAATVRNVPAARARRTPSEPLEMSLHPCRDAGRRAEWRARLIPLRARRGWPAHS